MAALPEGGRPERDRPPRRRGASTRTAARARSACVSFDPDDVYVLPQLGWTPDSRGVAFQHLNRAQNELELRLLPVPASPRRAARQRRECVLTERSKAWVNTFGAPRFLKDGRRFLWLSERDGFAHLYLCDLAGACRAVTQGPWMVDGRVSFTGSGPGFVLDERSGFLYFTATEKDPRERHLYRVRLDGTGRTRLTREDGTHRTVVSPDGRFYADTWSDVHDAAARLGDEPGRHAPLHARGERRPGDPEVRARQPRVGRAARRPTGRRSTARC